MVEVPVTVTFQVDENRAAEFITWIEQSTNDAWPPYVRGWRTGEGGARLPWRDALRHFANEMEKVLKAHDHKTGWHERPVEALISKMMLEVEEFKVAIQHFEIKEARGELIDVANFCLIVYDRLSVFDQDKTMQEQPRDKQQSVPT